MTKLKLSEIAKRRILAAKKSVATRLAKKKELEALKQRDILIEQYMPYASSIASRVAKSLSLKNEYEDVLCNARLGLLEAAKRFDYKEKVDFRTFAYYRIKGAIYDGLRKSGWLPRSVYTRIKFEEASNEYLRFVSENGRVPAEGEQMREVSDTVNTLASIYIMSLDVDEDLDIEDTTQQNLDMRAEFHQVRTHMREAIATLPPKEKQLIMMYYFQNKTLEEAGQKLELSKSWTSRLHARALELLLKRTKALSERGTVDEEGEEERIGE